MISILLAVYNGEKYLKESLDSVLNQTFTEFELLIGLNGCTDSTKEIIESYSDKRIKLFDYLDDKGKSKTLNKLIKESSYDWCAIQDADDIWISNKLESQVQFMNEYQLIGTYCKYINGYNDIIGSPKIYSDSDSIKRHSLNGNNQIINMSAIFKKSDICLWDEDIVGVEDYDFWLKLLTNGYVAYNVPEYLVHHRVHPESNFNTNSYDIKKIIKKYVN